MECFNGFSRWLIAIISIIAIICSVAVTVYIYFHEKEKDWSKLSDNNIPMIAIFFAMGICFFVSLIGILVCCCKKRCLYITYLIVLIIVLILEIAIIAGIFGFKGKITDAIEKNWLKDNFKKVRIEIEEKLKCCGFKNQEPVEECGYKTEENTTELCYDKIKKDFDDNMKSVLIGVIVIGAIELILLICTIYLVCCDKEKAQVENNLP